MSVEKKLMETKLDGCWLAIARGARDLNKDLGKKIFGGEYTEIINSTGDKVLKIDSLADYKMSESLRGSYCCDAYASEERESIEKFAQRTYSTGKYLVCFDPLDGSDNYRCDNPVGTIFSVLGYNDALPTEESFLQPGKNILAAGYVLYGPKPIMVLADHITNSVRSFIINDDQSNIQLPLLTDYQKDIKCPEEGKIVAVNSGNYPRWGQLTKDWFDTRVEYGKSSFRYSGCMVADFHRVLLQGGIFAYPADTKNKNGKLRLLFECAPLAYIMHMAGGTSTTGDGPNRNILDIKPSSLHSTTPVFLGSKVNIEDYFRG